MATRVVISAPRPAPFFTPLFVAIDKEFLAEEGIEGVMRYQAGVDDLLRGEVDFASGMGAYRSFLDGESIRQVAGLSSRESSHLLMARPEIEDVRQLEHILIPGGTGSHAPRFITELTNILSIHGVNLQESGIEAQGIEGSHKEQWQMLGEGIGDAATLGAPWSIIATKAGYRCLGHESDYSPSPSGAGIYVSQEMIAKDPELVAGFVRAYVKSMQYCRDNIPGTLETIATYSSDWGVDSLEIARAAYDEVAPFWRMEVDASVLGEAMRKLCEQAGRPPAAVEEFLVSRFLYEALHP